jgi:bifunctional enzyme CysN/CysC
LNLKISVGKQVKENFKLVVVGHVDHGKSTLMGRLLADSGSLPDGKLDQVRQFCKNNSRPFEYAFLLDALKDEKSQGITIDSARFFFQSKQRSYLILDSPGHIEFLRNMVTGASNAHGALLVIDANEGVQENSRRHATLLSMLGVRQIVVLVNKMDLVDYSQRKFDSLVSEFSEFLEKLEVVPTAWIPVSGMQGDHIVEGSRQMTWYSGSSLLKTLDSLKFPPSGENGPMRLFVQDIYKFTNLGDQRRIIAGTLSSGKLQQGSSLTFYPSLKRGVVKTVEAFPPRQVAEVKAGQAIGFTLQEQLYLKRGDLVCLTGKEGARVSSRFKASIFWLGKSPLEPHKDYGLRLGTHKVSVRITQIEQVLDASTLDTGQGASEIRRNEVGRCILKTKTPLAFDLIDSGLDSSRFVLVDDYDIAGGGIITEEVEDDQGWVRDEVKLRNEKWTTSLIPASKRAEQYNQKSALVLITGPKDSGKKPLARALEMELFESGNVVYFLGIANILYGIDADIKGHEPNPKEHLRRMAEVAHLMLDAGLILILTAVDLSHKDLEMISTLVDPQRIATVWVGSKSDSTLSCDIQVDSSKPENAVQTLKAHLQNRGLIFNPE